jgi:hypothetical protein
MYDHWARSTSTMFSTEGWCLNTEREARAHEKWKMLCFLTSSTDVQSLQISDELEGAEDDDPFTEKLMSFEVQLELFLIF